MKVLVTGGTGFIGERLVRALAERGDEVVVLSRRDGTSEHAKQVVWTPEVAGPWVSEVKKADAIVHLAGANILGKRWTEEHLRACRASRTVPTRIIAEAIAAAAAAAASAGDHPKIFVSASAVGYYGYRMDDRVCNEDAPVGDDVIAQLVAAWEDACAPTETADARRNNVRVVKARIGVVLGPEGGALAQMRPIFQLGLGGPLGAGSQMLPWVHADDTVNALMFAIDTPSLSGPVNVTTPNPVTMTTFAKELGRVLRRPSFFRVPAFVLRIAVGDGADVVLTGQNAMPAKLLEAGFSFRYPQLFDALTEAVGNTS